MSVTVDGRAPQGTPESLDAQTVLLPLGGLLPDGATTTIRLAFRATLRSGTGGSDWLLTKAGGIVAAYRWLPWVSRRVPFARPNHGDPFVTPISPRVKVRITTERPMAIATSGRRVAVDGRTQTFVATDVRDFVIAARARVLGNRRADAVRVHHLPGGLPWPRFSPPRRGRGYGWSGSLDPGLYPV
jgi:hypothetical protein